MRLKEIKYLVVHCSDTPDERDVSVADIHDMHLGFGWDGIGYHKLITRDGTVHNGRPEFWQGAHVQGQNHHSLGVCLIGRHQFTDAQFAALETVLLGWTARYPDAQIVGHRDIQLEDKKSCPNFDAGKWWSEHCALTADSAHIITPFTGLYATPPDRPDGVPEALDTECLYGERLEILEAKNHNGYVRARLVTDGYEGWVSLGDIACISPHDKPDHVITTRLATVTQTAQITSASLISLPMASRCKLIKIHGDIAEIRLWGRAGAHRSGFVAAKAISSSPGADDWIEIASQFLATPYKWGGRTAHGLDCSALIQLALQGAGIDFARDSAPQYEMLKNIACTDETAFHNFERGDLIYWKGHVGVMIDKSHLLHANGFHHAVMSEPVIEAIARIKTGYGAPIAHIRADRLASLFSAVNR
jgi:N-acetylmuramoyl-L-alanine amidase